MVDLGRHRGRSCPVPEFLFDLLPSLESKLLAAEVIVQPLPLQELVMRSLLGNFPLFKHHNHVCGAHGAETVRNDERGSAVQAVDVFLDSSFGFRVQRTGGFVENQNRGPMINSAGYGNSLSVSRPPDIAIPDSPIFVSYPSGSRSINSLAFAARAAQRTRSMSGSSSPKAMLCAMVVLNR